MIAATRESAGRLASRSGMPIAAPPRCGSTSSSTICTWPPAKTSVCFAAGTPMFCEIACAVSSSEETMWSEVELALAPHLQVLRVARADDRLRLGGEAAGEQRRDDVDLVARRARDEQLRVADAGVEQHLPARAVAGDDAGVEAVGDRVQARLVEVDDGDGVLLVERLHGRRAYLAGADDEHLHPAREARRSRAAVPRRA